MNIDGIHENENSTVNTHYLAVNLFNIMEPRRLSNNHFSVIRASAMIHLIRAIRRIESASNGNEVLRSSSPFFVLIIAIV